MKYNNPHHKWSNNIEWSAPNGNHNATENSTKLLHSKAKQKENEEKNIKYLPFREPAAWNGDDLKDRKRQNETSDDTLKANRWH